MASIKPRAEWLAALCNGTMTLDSNGGRDEQVAAQTLLPPSFFQDPFTNNVAVISATLFCWEYLMTMPSELRLYFTIPWRAPHLILFVVMRYSTFIAISLGVYSTWHRQLGDCVAYGEIATLLVQLCVSSVLGWRAIAIWQKDARIIVIILLLVVILMLFSTLLVLSMKAHKQSNGTCTLVQGGNYDFFPLAWFYAGTVLYDTIVIILSTYRLWQHHKDVGFFPGANAQDMSKRSSGWVAWVHSQWTGITPLLFRMTSNGLLYLAFSTVFNTVCFIIGHWNESHAQDLMLLYSSVMWVVCQHLVLLEIKATWGHTPASGILAIRDANGNDETDRLIAQILQASWSTKPPPPNGGKTCGTRANIDPELVLSFSMDSCLREAPHPQRLAKGTRMSCQPNATHVRQHSLARSLQHNLGGQLSVQQLHDFRPCMPGDAEFSLKCAVDEPTPSPIGEADRSTNALIGVNDESGPGDTRTATFRQRLGALRTSPSPNKLLATLTRARVDVLRPSTGDSCVVVDGDIDHPLQSVTRDSTSRFHRFSHPFERMLTETVAPTIRPKTCPEAKAEARGLRCNRGVHAQMPKRDESMRKPEDARKMTSSLEVEDMLANMPDEAKAQALQLAGMERAGQIHTASSFTSMFASPTAKAKANKSSWIIHPPL